MKTASKSDLIVQVSARSGINRTTVGEVIDTLVAEIAAITTAGDAVTLKGFGRFEMRDRAERDGRNPATGEAIRIPASRHLAFKASKS
jgi:nucleoid DNA-binding protein